LTLTDFDLIKHYQQFFRVTIAKTPEEMEMAYQLRHKVFRIDCGFDDLGCLSTEDTEQDEFDKSAIHVLLLNKENVKQQAIGYVRLVLADENSKYGLPIEYHYLEDYELNNTLINPKSIVKTGRRCEISRISILRSYRQRKSDRYEIEHSKDRRRKDEPGESIKIKSLKNNRRKSDFVNQDEYKKTEDSRRYPVNYLPLCLAFAAINLVESSNFEYTFLISEKKIIRFFSYFGIKFYSIGHIIDYNGNRKPFILNVQETLARLGNDYHNLYDVIGNELNSALR
jgi:hypothetical protein